MKTNKIFFFAILILFLIVPISAYAETERGRNFDRELLSVNQDGSRTYKWTSTPERIVDYVDISGNQHYADYRLYENQASIRLESASSGSVIFDKNTCSYNLYDAGYLAENNMPKIKGISWTVKGKAATSQTWSNVNSMNGATCQTSITSNQTHVSITGSKASSVGTFQIRLDYSLGMGIKETMKAYNNNPAWTNHNIGFTETFEVPRVIHFGNQTFDLANYNNTVLDRTWIDSHEARIVTLSNKIFYDFGIGFDNLNDIKITWDGSKARLSLNYLYPTGTIPYQTWIEVDPTFGYSTTGTRYAPQANVAVGLADASCNHPNYAVNALGTRVQKRDAASATECGSNAWQWDVTTIPDSSVINSGTLRYDNVVSINPINCDVTQVTVDLTTATGQQMWDDVVGVTSNVDYVSNDATCTTTGNDKTISLGATFVSYLQATGLGQNRIALGFFFNDQTRDASNHAIDVSTPELQVVYTVGPPDAVTTLVATTTGTTTVDLTWSAPNLNSGTLQRYVINYTTPCGVPSTHLANGTTATSYTVSGLTALTCYSFLVSAATEGGYNFTGNVANATTLAFNAANYTIGSFNFNANNQNIFPIRYERIDSGSTTLVNITFTNTISLACDLRYTYAGTNHTYHSISSIPVSSTEDEASFSFTNSSNDITTFHCWNQAGNQSANYVLTQTDFLLKQQVRDFRNGTYGTMGQFGAFDLIALIVVIISMIGLNRNTEAVAGIFCIIAITVLAYFEIVSWITAIVSAAAVIMLFIVAGTKKT